MITTSVAATPSHTSVLHAKLPPASAVSLLEAAPGSTRPTGAAGCPTLVAEDVGASGGANQGGPTKLPSDRRGNSLGAGAASTTAAAGGVPAAPPAPPGPLSVKMRTTRA